MLKKPVSEIQVLEIRHKQATLSSLPGFHDDSDTLRVQQFLQGHGDLLGQTLLNLKATTEHFGKAGNLAQTNDLTVLGDVTNMNLKAAIGQVKICQPNIQDKYIIG